MDQKILFSRECWYNLLWHKILISESTIQRSGVMNSKKTWNPGIWMNQANWIWTRVFTKTCKVQRTPYIDLLPLEMSHEVTTCLWNVTDTFQIGCNHVFAWDFHPFALITGRVLQRNTPNLMVIDHWRVTLSNSSMTFRAPSNVSKEFNTWSLI